MASTGKRHVIELPKLPIAFYRVQGFDVALESRPEATVVDVPGVTASAETRPEVLNLIRAQLAPLWNPSALDVLAS